MVTLERIYGHLNLFETNFPIRIIGNNRYIFTFKTLFIYRYLIKHSKTYVKNKKNRFTHSSNRYNPSYVRARK